MVEGTGLENRRTGNGIVSSNLTLSVLLLLSRAPWMGGRVVEGARLESVWARKGLASSNLAPSAKRPVANPTGRCAFQDRFSAGLGTGSPARADKDLVTKRMLRGIPRCGR